VRYFVEGLTTVYGGESAVRHIGDFDTLEEAVHASQTLIDDFLRARCRPGLTIAELLFQYQKFGEVPFIFSDSDRTMNVPDFNHFKYAMSCCTAICANEQREEQR
jgi:hypothetical protein